MIALPTRALPPATATELATFQETVGGTAGGYAARVEKAKSLFTAKNKADDPVFSVVRSHLTAMCSGAFRCVYCEDSARDQVEHFRPKTLYPEATFVWENYVYACGRCNRIKSDRFAVFRASDGAFTDVTRARRAPVVPPTAGDPVLLFGRVDDPMEFLELDLVDTFFFTVRPNLPPRSQKRAEHTIIELKLNERDELPVARQQAYGDFRARVREYRHLRDAGANGAELQALQGNLQRCNHITVWKEMKRQRATVAELSALFDEVPEALHW